MIYLDNASTTPIDPLVLDAMMPYLRGQFGNPGTIYSLGRHAKEAIEVARAQVARYINASPEEIIFTSGGTEANNTVFNDVLSIGDKWKDIVSTESEHDSVLRSIKNLCDYGYKFTKIPVRKSDGDAGSVNLNILEEYLKRTRASLVSVMYMNNETGAINPVNEISELCDKYGSLFHTDCVQAATCCPIDVKEIGCNYLTLSSHKIYGPKGVGALYVKNTNLNTPLIKGGTTQEFGFRGGTENVAGIVGFGAACELMTKNLHDIDVHVSILKQLFYNTLLRELGEDASLVHVNGNIMRHGKILNIRIDGIEGETLTLFMDSRDVCISSGSACRSHESEPSRALLDMGLTPTEARQSVRISFGKNNTKEEVELAASIMAEVIKQIKNII